MKPVMILVLGSQQILRDVVVGILATSPDISLVGDAAEALARGHQLKLLALSKEGETGFLCRLAPQRIPLGELSPELLVAAVLNEEGS